MKKNFTDLKRTLLSKLSVDGGIAESVSRTMECEVEFSSRMRTVAGKANYIDNTVTLNRRVFDAHPEHLDQTFAHELAHLAAFEIYGTRGTGHGRYWQVVMRKFGYPATRCHDLAAARALSRPHPVVAMAKCNCRMWDIKAQRFKKMIAGNRYRCGKCKHLLVLMKGK